MQQSSGLHNFHASLFHSHHDPCRLDHGPRIQSHGVQVRQVSPCICSCPPALLRSRPSVSHPRVLPPYCSNPLGLPLTSNDVFPLRSPRRPPPASADPSADFPVCSYCNSPSLHIRRCAACRCPGYCRQGVRAGGWQQAACCSWCSASCTQRGAVHHSVEGNTWDVMSRSRLLCSTAVVCSKECQRGDWPRHKAECKAAVARAAATQGA